MVYKEKYRRPFCVSHRLFHAFHVAKSLNSAAVWGVIAESEETCETVCLLVFLSVSVPLLW